jgi:hypothetical protein
MCECECEWWECDGEDEWRLCADDFLRNDVGIGKESDKDWLESSAAERRARNSVREKGGRRTGTETEPGVEVESVGRVVLRLEGRKKGEGMFIWIRLPVNIPCHVKNWSTSDGRRKAMRLSICACLKCFVTALLLPSAFYIVVWLR